MSSPPGSGMGVRVSRPLPRADSPFLRWSCPLSTPLSSETPCCLPRPLSVVPAPSLPPSCPQAPSPHSGCWLGGHFLNKHAGHARSPCGISRPWPLCPHAAVLASRGLAGASTPVHGRPTWVAPSCLRFCLWPGCFFAKLQDRLLIQLQDWLAVTTGRTSLTCRLRGPLPPCSSQPLRLGLCGLGLTAPLAPSPIAGPPQLRSPQAQHGVPGAWAPSFEPTHPELLIGHPKLLYCPGPQFFHL